MNNEFALLRLADGSHVMVDAIELPFLNRYSWFRDKDGYVVANVHHGNTTQRVSLSRVVNRTPDGFVTDHKNGDLNDYTQKNLRTATRSQNHANIGKRRGEYSSKFKGVGWHIRGGKWRAFIKVNYRQISLGMYADEEEAALAYNLAAKKFFGEFARLNKVSRSALSGEGQKAFDAAIRKFHAESVVFD
jgi:hypothetical protein